MTHLGPEHPAQHVPGQPAPGQPVPGQPAPGQHDPEWPTAAPGAAVPAAAAPAPQWAWVQQPLQTVETPPLEYHRLLRGIQGYRWWKPLMLLLLSGVYFGVFTVVVSLLFVPIMMAFDPNYAMDLATGSAAMIDTQRPISVLLSMVSIIIMIPAVLLAMLSLGIRPLGRVWSVAGRIRWGLLARLFGIALVSVLVMNVAGIATEWALNPTTISEPMIEPAREFDTNAALLSLLFIIVLVPFQATAEEVVFRGLFMQVIGAWLKNPWFAILIPSVGFAMANIYDIWGLAAVGLMGGVAAWLSWRTGGLEAAIAIHVVNNLIAFGFMTAGVGGETAQVSESGGAGTLVGEIVGLGVFIWLTLKVFRRGGHGRTRIDLVQVPAVVPAGGGQFSA